MRANTVKSRLAQGETLFGTMIFEFGSPVDINALRLLDIEGAEAVTVRSYDANGNLIGTVTVNGNGNNSVQLVDINANSGHKNGPVDRQYGPRSAGRGTAGACSSRCSWNRNPEHRIVRG